MNILVFGGTGAMGIHVVDILSQQGHSIDITTRRQLKSNNSRINYVCGDAHDIEFVKSIIKVKQYDVLVDFMIYTFDEFKRNFYILAESVGQYIFFSSARVYAESGDRITEASKRLLDVSTDQEYLKTDEYALTKAREEDYIRNSKFDNWTIIRPYITYSEERLQLGVLEKEYWLQRALNGKTIVFFDDMAKKYTTLTYGRDVAYKIAELIGNKDAIKEVYHITNDEAIMWKDVLRLYQTILSRCLGRNQKVCLIDNAEGVSKILGNQYQIYYDRMYDRKFNSHKINLISDSDMEYIETTKGLEKCLREFLSNCDKRFLGTNWCLETYFDRITGERTRLRDIVGYKNKIGYFMYRYTPYLRWKKNIKL